MRAAETSVIVSAAIYVLVLFVSVGIHKYAWWKYSKGTSIFDPMFSSPASAVRFMKDPEFFIKPDGLKYIYWSQRVLRFSTIGFVVGLLVFHFVTGK